MEFRVTPEILEIFKDVRLSDNNIKKFLPNWEDYRIIKQELTDDMYLDYESSNLSSFLDTNFTGTPNQLLEQIKENLETLKDDNIYNFHFEDLEYGDISIYSTRMSRFKEKDDSLLRRLASEIRQAKQSQKSKEDAMNKLLDISNFNKEQLEELIKVANDKLSCI